MKKRFRALRLISTVNKIVAWVVAIGMALLALVVVILGAIQGRGAPSVAQQMIPGMGQFAGALSGVLVGIMLLIMALVWFVLIHAWSDAIDLAIAIEENTRETAQYLKGETSLPAPPEPISWQTPLSEAPPKG